MHPYKYIILTFTFSITTLFKLFLECNQINSQKYDTNKLLMYLSHNRNRLLDSVTLHCFWFTPNLSNSYQKRKNIKNWYHGWTDKNRQVDEWTYIWINGSMYITFCQSRGLKKLGTESMKKPEKPVILVTISS